MPQGANGGVDVRLDGAHLRVDARPARLVSLLEDASGTPLVVARGAGGASHTERLPSAARQATFRVRDDITVEATAAAKFVAVADETGPCLVIAYDGEVTVIPFGDDRFALGAHEALVIKDHGDPAVVPAAELTEAAHPELAAMLDAAAEAVLPLGGAPTTAPRKPAGEATPAAVGGAAKPAGKHATKASGQRRKKGKKRAQPTKTAKKAGAGASTAAAATTKAAKATKATAAGGGKPPAPKDPPPKGGGGGGDGDAEEERRDNRFLIGAVAIGLLLAVAAVLVLSNTGDDDTDLASGPDTTETTSTLGESTTEPPASTTEAPTTTTVASTTTASGSQAKYAITPKSCVQNGNSVTYTASITNQADDSFDYEIEVSYTTSDGAEVARATANVSRLTAGATAEFSATGTSSRNLAGTGAECKVVRVEPEPTV